MSPRTFLFVGAGAILLAVLAGLAASSVTFRYTHPQAPDLRIVVDRHGARLDLDAAREQVARQTGVKGLPRAVVRVTDYEFGTMDPLTSGSHDFSIENVGDAPLLLEQGPTSCKCTLSGLTLNRLLPGETGHVRLEWFTGETQSHFAQTAVIYTNDPTQRHIALGVSGKVRMLIGASQQQLVLDRIEPDRPATGEILLYSQIWDNFEVQHCGASLAGISFEVDRLDPAGAPELEAKSVQRIRFTLPGTLPQGAFTGTLRFRVQPPGAEAAQREVTVPLHGKVLRRLSFYGAGLSDDGVLDLGTVPKGKGHKRRLIAKIRDPEPELRIASVQVQPGFLQVRFEPHVEAGVAGLYDLTVEIPADAPAGSYLGRPSGQIRIDLANPRIDDVTLEVRFAIAP